MGLTSKTRSPDRKKLEAKTVLLATQKNSNMRKWGRTE